MKAVIAMILLLSLYDASAYEIRVSSMKRVSDSYSEYQLKTSLGHKVILDCQSFLQGLFLGDLGDEVIPLEEGECQELVTSIKRSRMQFKKHCLNVDPGQSFLVSQGTCP